MYIQRNSLMNNIEKILLQKVKILQKMKESFQDGNELEQTNDKYSQLVDAASEQVYHLFE